MNDRLAPRRAFGDVLAGQLHSMASDYEHLARLLREQADRTTDIGTNRATLNGAAGRPITAADIAIDSVTAIHRHTPQTTGLLRAAADYDRDVPGFLGETR